MAVIATALFVWRNATNVELVEDHLNVDIVPDGDVEASDGCDGESEVQAKNNPAVLL